MVIISLLLTGYCKLKNFDKGMVGSAMGQEKFRVEYLLSVIIAILAGITSLGGLLMSNLYRDNSWTVNQLRGNDLVTIVIAVPLLGLALFMARRGSLRWQLVWIAMLGYMVYNYLFYLFGSAFNYFFLLYVGLVSLSAATLFMALSRLDIRAAGASFSQKTPAKWIGAYMLVIATFLGGMWLVQCVAFIFTGQLPAVITTSGAATSVVFACDLALLIPVMVLGGILLWLKRAWGYILGVIMMIKDTTYTLALLAMGWFAYLNGTLGGDWVLLILWGIFCVGCLIATVLLLVNITGTEKGDKQLGARAFSKEKIEAVEPAEESLVR